MKKNMYAIILASMFSLGTLQANIKKGPMAKDVLQMVQNIIAFVNLFKNSPSILDTLQQDISNMTDAKEIHAQARAAVQGFEDAIKPLQRFMFILMTTDAKKKVPQMTLKIDDKTKKPALDKDKNPVMAEVIDPKTKEAVLESEVNGGMVQFLYDVNSASSIKAAQKLKTMVSNLIGMVSVIKESADLLNILVTPATPTEIAEEEEGKEVDLFE